MTLVIIDVIINKCLQRQNLKVNLSFFSDCLFKPKTLAEIFYHLTNKSISKGFVQSI